MDKSHLDKLEAEINLRIQQAALALARLLALPTSGTKMVPLQVG